MRIERTELLDDGTVTVTFNATPAGIDGFLNLLRFYDPYPFPWDYIAERDLQQLFNAMQKTLLGET